ncbi:MAG: hypothetical protein ACXVEF_09845 [Polyangiales bacterium]
MSFGGLLRAGVIGLAVAIVAAPGCAVDEAPGGVRKAQKTDGPTVVFDMSRKPLPELPLPNDVATYPDPTSRTGRRINASLVAPTQIERQARGKFSKLEGWGTFAPISIPFDKPLDAEDVKKRHADDDFAFEDDAVYLVNLKTGVPVPLDLGGGNFPVTLRETARYWPNDPGKGEANILFETRDEDLNHNGILDPGEDTDFDGVLDRPNFPGFQRPANGVDGLYTFYESETNSLVARPMIPLDEMTEYAFVITDRLHGTDGKAIQSPFEYIHHPAQRMSVERAAAAMERKQEYYGFTGGSPLDHVQFVFTFTTQPTVSDMFALRDGAYGKGKFGWIGNDYPPEIHLAKAVGQVDPVISEGAVDPAGWQSKPSCTEQTDKSLYVAHFTPSLKDSLKTVADSLFGIGGPAGARLIESFDNIAYIAVGTIKVPWLLGDINDMSPERTIEMNQETGEIPHSDTEVSFFIVVPKTTEKHKPPFPVTFYGHGYTGNMTEGLSFAGDVARHGVVTIGMNAPGHGLELSEGDLKLARAIFTGACLSPFGSGFTKSRVRDLNHDGLLSDESGRDYWTAYLFHTRDLVRQAALEEVMVVRALRAFDGRKYDWREKAKGESLPDAQFLAGDFDQDGTIEFGGPDGKYFAWGGSLGGILSSLAGAVDPHISATAPMAGGGALTDVGIRSFQGGVVEAVDLRVMGPLLVSVPADSRFDCAKDADGKVKLDDKGKCILADVQTRTACKAGQKSVRWVAVDLNDATEFEIDCVDEAQLAKGMDVVVGNMTNGEVRCAKVTDEKADYKDSGSSDFRLGIPASEGDEIVISSYPPGSVLKYGKECTLKQGATPVKVVDKWNGLNGELCDATNTSGPHDCIKYQDKRYKLGSKLVSLSEGFGLRRQTPDFRKFMQLAQIALDPADPVSFAPYYYLRPRHDENGNTVPPAGILTINTVGDMNVPVNTGIAAARIHGAIPFLRPNNVAAKDYPDYVAPPDLLALYGDKTPNKVLLDNHVIEGIRWLARHPAPDTCAPNVRAFEGCTEATSYSSPQVCKEALFDPENLSEGAIPAKPQHPAVPLRLGRLARPTAGDASAVWAPRLSAAKDGWTPNGTLAAVLTAFIVPEGVHGFDPPDPCKYFDMGMYLTNMVGRFFGTTATDLPYLTQPKTHTCAAVTDWKAPEACDWK